MTLLQVAGSEIPPTRPPPSSQELHNWSANSSNLIHLIHFWWCKIHSKLSLELYSGKSATWKTSANMRQCPGLQSQSNANQAAVSPQPQVRPWRMTLRCKDSRIKLGTEVQAHEMANLTNCFFYRVKSSKITTSTRFNQFQKIQELDEPRRTGNSKNTQPYLVLWEMLFPFEHKVSPCSLICSYLSWLLICKHKLKFPKRICQKKRTYTKNVLSKFALKACRAYLSLQETYTKRATFAIRSALGPLQTNGKMATPCLLEAWPPRPAVRFVWKLCLFLKTKTVKQIYITIY